jgi:HK97 family phage portal protein
MRFLDFFKNTFFQKTTNENGKEVITVAAAVEANQQIAIEEMAIFSCVNLLAGIISKCEFKTYIDFKPVKRDEYFLWNYEPNRNQNSVQLIQEFIARLLLNNEALMVEVGGQLHVAESYQHEEYALKDDMFFGVTCNSYSFSRPFSMPEVIFVRLNNSDIKQTMRGLYALYSKAIGEAFDKYQSSGGKSGILHINGAARGSPTFEADLEKLMNDRFRRFFSSKNAVLPLFDGYEYAPQTSEAAKKTTNEVSDIKSLTEQAFGRAANAFKIAPQLLRGDVTNVNDAINATLTFAVDPIIRQLEVEIVRKRYGNKAMQTGNYLRIDTTRIKHVDVFEVAEKADKLIAARLYNPNEMRDKIGDERIPQPWADEYVLTKNYEAVGTVDATKGGENNAVTSERETGGNAQV